MNESSSFDWSCPTPDRGEDGRVLLAHGEGGRLSRQLLYERVLPALGLTPQAALTDAALLPAVEGPLAFTTDAYIITPLFFPGGDIGSLAVHGTANDLAVSGARPLWLSLSLLLEEGLPFETLDRVLTSVARAAGEQQISIVTGDTKVAPRGALDGMFLVTSGIGRYLPNATRGIESAQPGDVLLVSGPIARHGMAILAARERLEFTPPIASDSGHLWPAVETLVQAGVAPQAMRDATRGGVAAVLHEWAAASGLTLQVDEASLPVTSDVRGACELLGIDPLFVACEGTMVVAVAEHEADRALAALRAIPISAQAAVIGCVLPPAVAPVVARGLMGQSRVLDEPTAALLPRIC